MENIIELDGNEERYNFTDGETFGNQQRDSEELFWDFKINILGKKDDTQVHFCNKCELPIRVYGRMIPCKHAFCYTCAILHGSGNATVCPGCGSRARRIEKHGLGSLFMCGIVQECKRTYLSERDLQAHINFRHMEA